MLSLAWVLLACSSGDIDSQGSCGLNGACPPGYECEPTLQRCLRSVSPGAPDASPPPPAPDAAAVVVDAGVDAAAGADATVDAAGPSDAPGPDAADPNLAVDWLDGTTPADGARTSSGDVHLVFGFTDPGGAAGAHLECSDDGADFVACESPVGFTVIAVTGEDRFTYAVRGVDGTGRAGPEIFRSWVLDTLAPHVVISGTPAEGSVTRSTSTSLAVAFSPAEPEGSVIECSATGPAGPFTSEACANRGGLADGRQQLAARGRDAAGNLGEPAVRTWTVDTDAPSVVLGGTPRDGAVTSTRATSFTWGFDGTVAGGVLECKLAGPGRTESFAAAGCANRQQLADGAWTFSVRGRDAAGNVSEAATVAWRVDTIAPQVAWGPSTPEDGAVTASPEVSFSWDFIDPADAPGGRLEYSLDGVLFVAAPGVFATTLTQDGRFELRARGVDAAGNRGPAIQRSLTLSTVGPAVTIGGTPADGDWLTSPTTSFTFASVAGATFECSVDDGAFADCTDAAINQLAFAEGPHAVAVRARLVQGSPGAAQAVHFIVDTVAPVATLTGATPRDNTASEQRTLVITFTVDDAAAAATCLWDGEPEACTSPASHTFDLDGVHAAAVRATDEAGNTGPPSAATVYRLDARRPLIIFDEVAAPLANRFTFRWHSDETNVRYFCHLDGMPLVTCTSQDGFNGTFTGSVTVARDHVFSVDAQDEAGNVGTAAWTWRTN